MSPVRIKVKSGGIRHVAAGIVRHDGDVIADLVLVGITFERIKGGTHRHVRRPRDAGIRAIGIE